MRECRLTGSTVSTRRSNILEPPTAREWQCRVLQVHRALRRRPTRRRERLPPALRDGPSVSGGQASCGRMGHPTPRQGLGGRRCSGNRGRHGRPSSRRVRAGALPGHATAGTVHEVCFGLEADEIDAVRARLPKDGAPPTHRRGFLQFDDFFGFRWTLQELDVPFKSSGEIARRWLEVGRASVE